MAKYKKSSILANVDEKYATEVEPKDLEFYDIRYIVERVSMLFFWDFLTRYNDGPFQKLLSDGAKSLSGEEKDDVKKILTAHFDSTPERINLNNKRLDLFAAAIKLRVANLR